MATSYIYIDIYIDIYFTFTNWRSIHSFYWTLFLKTLSCKAPLSANNYIHRHHSVENAIFLVNWLELRLLEKNYAKSDLSRREIIGQVEL